MPHRQQGDSLASVEGVCDDCGREYPTPWYAPNDQWNAVVGSPNGMLCPSCFMVRSEGAFDHPIWKLTVDDWLGKSA